MKNNRHEKFNGQCGDVFGRLTLTGESYIKVTPTKRGRVVEAVCFCGVIKNYWYTHLRNGDTQSCGCYQRESSKKRMTTHNLSNHKLYDVWQKMIDRCYNSESDQFKDYGGRGIEVWKDWKEEFIEFYEWAIFNGYKEGLCLDRADNDDNYAPYNCRFSTHAENNRNTRRNRMITAFGETKCLFDWGKDSRCKVSVWSLRSRLDRGKWTDMEKMITDPQTEKKESQRRMKTNKMITAFGETKCLNAWLEDERCLVKLDSLRDRFGKGWDGVKILTTPPHSSGKKGIILN